MQNNINRQRPVLRRVSIAKGSIQTNGGRQTSEPQVTRTPYETFQTPISDSMMNFAPVAPMNADFHFDYSNDGVNVNDDLPQDAYETRRDDVKGPTPLGASATCWDFSTGGVFADSIDNLMDDILSTSNVNTSLLNGLKILTDSPALRSANMNTIGKMTKALGKLAQNNADIFCCMINTVLWCAYTGDTPCCGNIDDLGLEDRIQQYYYSSRSNNSLYHDISLPLYSDVSDTASAALLAAITASSSIIDAYELLCDYSKALSPFKSMLGGLVGLGNGFLKEFCCLLKTICACRLSTFFTGPNSMDGMFSASLEQTIIDNNNKAAGVLPSFTNVMLAIDNASAYSSDDKGLLMARLMEILTDYVEDVSELSEIEAKNICCGLKMLCDECGRDSCVGHESPCGACE